MMKKVIDRLSPEIRIAEAEIDSAYISSLLTRMEFAPAIWNVLGVVEDWSYQLMHDSSVDRLMHEGIVDSFIFTLKHPLHWLRASCPPGGRAPLSYNEDLYLAARDLLLLAAQYDQFCLVFTYASRGLAELRLEGHKLIPTYSFPNESRYQAYDRLVKPIDRNTSKDTAFSQLDELYSRIDRSLKIDGENFSFNLNPQLVRYTMNHLEPVMRLKFVLPENWQFSRYTLLDFRKVYHAIYALSYLQMLARIRAAARGCIGIGFANSLYVPTKDELISRVVRYTGLARDIVVNVLHDITLGSHGMTAEGGDPALQPLIELTDERYVVSPTLWINSAAERNFLVLMNRIPSEKAIYSRLVEQKEDLMRQRIISLTGHARRRMWSGRIPGRPTLPDIDLAIIDDTEKCCLLMELKWFIEPAEAREVVEKSEEIAKGVSQLLLLKKTVEGEDSSLLNELKIDTSYSVGYAVISANSIGDAGEQHSDIAVLREDHMIEVLSSSDSLLEITSWLSRRLYLPIEGTHYEVITTSAQVGRWETTWYGIRPLIEDEFKPLP
jgi:hypothetical protein